MKERRSFQGDFTGGRQLSVLLYEDIVVENGGDFNYSVVLLRISSNQQESAHNTTSQPTTESTISTVTQVRDNTSRAVDLD